MTAKSCSKCRVEKPLSEFSVSKRYADGYRGQCKRCRTSYNTDFRKRTGYKAPRKKDSAAALHRRKIKMKYKMTIETYEAMVADQNGACAICNKVPHQKRLSVDHCHTTGKVRGLLCNYCNIAIGHLGDGALGVQRALDYLRRAT